MLSKEQLEFYEKNGYILLDNIFEQGEIEECSERYDELFDLKAAASYNLEGTWGGSWKKDKEGMGVETKKTSVSNNNIVPRIYTDASV
jgi:hypothetical protein